MLGESEALFWGYPPAWKVAIATVAVDPLESSKDYN